MAVHESLGHELIEQWKQKVYKRASRSRKQTTQNIMTMTTVCTSSHGASVGVAVVRRPEVTVGNGGLMEARWVTSCIMGGCVVPVTCIEPVAAVIRRKKSFGLVLLLIMIQQHSNMKVIKSNDNSSARNGKEQKRARREPVKSCFSVQLLDM